MAVVVVAVHMYHFVHNFAVAVVVAGVAAVMDIMKAAEMALDCSAN